MSERRVVITGLGPVTPIGIGTESFWAALLEGRSGIRQIETFDPSRFDSRIAGAVEDAKVADYVPKSYRKASKIMARDIVLAVIAAHQAATDAGLKTKCLIDRGEADGEPNIDSRRFGANIGAGLICADLHELAEALATAGVDGTFSMAKWGNEGMNTLTPLWLLKFLPNMLACHVTIVHQAYGPSNTITCGEASSHLAIGEAFRTIAGNTADVCICGGAESKLSPMALMRQSLGKRLSQRNDTPETAVRPFAADRDGSAVSEGGGLVILESLDHAKKRGARIYAELVGFGASNDAHSPGQPSQPHPEGRGVAVAMKKALRDAGLTPGDISLAAAAAAGLREHDLSEAKAFQTVFGERVSELPVMSIKGAVGNNGAGSGAIDFIAAILALYHRTIPSTINSQSPDPACGLRVVTNGPIDANIEAAISTSYALGGGQNAALVIRRYAE
ncbi:MAG: beta-ketoacyl-[acyl-carrier-protein] synthase family protein [Phycisphaerae bacterium]|nr:beta-ketoacyl-[acyl-carrier-protein] synthase family protein [Phycisphaerae bacterium]